MKILLGVSSSIAVYKALDLISQLRKKGHEIKVILTENATKMVSPIPFHTLSGNIVAYDEFGEKDYIPHISMSDWADIFVIVPATANVIGKMANGIADDLLTSTYISFNKPILISPAMNVKMYNHPAVQKNMQILAERGAIFVEPDTGMLACGYEGKGKLPPVETILHQIEEMDPGVEKVLKGKKVLVTAGGTIEDIDPVRFITNRSSGKMGFAFAEIAHRLGADVELIYAQTDHPPTPFLKSIFTRSAEDMLKALEARIEEADILIMAAAVADFRPAKTASKKIKKQDGNPVIELAENPDLLKTLGKNKKETQIFVGFALETDDLLENAQKKLKSKNLDMILANSPENFESESGKVQILFPGGDKEELPQISKMEIARKVYGILSKRFL